MMFDRMVCFFPSFNSKILHLYDIVIDIYDIVIELYVDIKNSIKKIKNGACYIKLYKVGSL